MFAIGRTFASLFAPKLERPFNEGLMQTKVWTDRDSDLGFRLPRASWWCWQRIAAVSSASVFALAVLLAWLVF
jgi:hypothetical protein